MIDYKGYITKNGDFAITDPSFDVLPVVRFLNPDFEIRSEPPSPNYVPRILNATRVFVPDLTLEQLPELTDKALWELHNGLLRPTEQVGCGEVNLLDLKIELAERAFRNCTLCGCQCRVNRFEKPGRCGLKDEAYWASLYVHIAEEPQITPTAVVKLFGCGLRCTGCQAHDVLSIPASGKTLVGPDLWRQLKKTEGFSKARTLEFVGGNPEESLYPILYSLSFAQGIALPIVWNCHGFGSATAFRILERLCDVYLPDFKFGPGTCCEKIAGVKDYWSVVTSGIQEIVRQDARVIVRILVMPGHTGCCHEPALKWLSSYKDRIWLSLVEYVPTSHVRNDLFLGRCTSVAEMVDVRNIAKSNGLRDVEDSNGRFWSA